MIRSLVVFFLCGGVAMAQSHPPKGRCADERAEVKKVQGWVSYDKSAKSPDLDVNVAKLASATSALEKCRSEATAKEETSRRGADSNQNASGYGSNFPSFAPLPVLRMPEIKIPPMPEMVKPVPVPEFHYIPPKQLYTVVPAPAPRPFGITPSAQPGLSSGCSNDGTTHEAEIQRAEWDLNQTEFNLQDLRFRYQNAQIAAQNAAQAAANTKGALGLDFPRHFGSCISGGFATQFPG